MQVDKLLKNAIISEYFNFNHYMHNVKYPSKFQFSVVIVNRHSDADSIPLSKTKIKSPIRSYYTCHVLHSMHTHVNLSLQIQICRSLNK